MLIKRVALTKQEHQELNDLDFARCEASIKFSHRFKEIAIKYGFNPDEVDGNGNLTVGFNSVKGTLDNDME